MLDYLEKEKRKEWKASEGIFHRHQYCQKEMTSLQQKREEQTEEKRMEEIFHLENAYGNIELGMNRQKEISFVVSRKKYRNGPVASKEQKELNQQRCKAWNHRHGSLQLNPLQPEKGAYAFQLNKEKVSGGEIIRETERFGRRMGQETIFSMLSAPYREERQHGGYSFHQMVAREMNQAVSRAFEKRKDSDDFVKRRAGGFIQEKLPFAHPAKKRKETEGKQEEMAQPEEK